MLFGGHVSIAGGLDQAVKRGQDRGFDVIQTFASSPRSFQVTNYTDEQIDAYKSAFKRSSLKQHFFHAVYLLNLASSKSFLVDLSIQSLVGYLNLGEKIDSQGTIFHLGSSLDREFDAVKDQVVSALRKILSQTSSSQNLIMEIAAGAGNVVGDSLEELAILYKEAGSERLKIALDTQHLYASGVDVSSYDEFDHWLKEFDRMVGVETLAAVHANDSKTDLASHRDRHENIGEGKIGKQGFRQILKQPLLQNTPFILEVPGFDETGPDKKNLEILKRLL